MRTTTDNPHLFQMAKEAVDITEAARRYGLEPDRKGWCRCPFHGEKTPSFHLYNQRGKCFGCGWSGDVVDLVAGILNVGPLEAVKELNRAFGLGIDLEAPVDTLELAQARAERREKERFRQWREGVIGALTEHFRALHLARVYGASNDPEKGVSDHYAAAVKELDRVEYYLDFVSYASEEEVRKAIPEINQVLKRIREEAGAFGQRGA